MGVLLMRHSLNEGDCLWEARIFSRASYYFRNSAFLETMRLLKSAAAPDPAGAPPRERFAATRRIPF
jgi:hypothetical protein